MGCHWSKEDEIVDSPPKYTQSAGPLVTGGQPKQRNRRPAKISVDLNDSSSSSIKDQILKLGQRSKSLSPVYHRLPKKAKKCTVKSVYDGDTITLRNNKRVRFLGIDTPELKNPTQPFSEEAKAYTVKRCGDNQIWISYEEGYDMVDRFGRQLCWIWIQKGTGKYECVNEGLIKEGFATVYIPSKNCKLGNVDKLLALQKEARIQRKGMWKSFKDHEVVKTMYGTAYHHRNCRCEHLQRSKTLTPILASVAMDEGRHACRTCLAE